MRFGESVVAGIVEWVEAEVKRGAFKPGELFPTERNLSERLGVSRGVIREAKAKLRGRGVVEGRNKRILFARRNTSSHFKEWAQRIERAGSDANVDVLEDILIFRRLLLPDLVATATRRATPEQRAELVDLLVWFRISFISCVIAVDARRFFFAFFTKALHLAAGEVWLALGNGLIEILWPAPIWRICGKDRTLWLKLLAEVSPLITEGNVDSVRQCWRTNLEAIDANLLEYRAAQNASEPTRQ